MPKAAGYDLILHGLDRTYTAHIQICHSPKPYDYLLITPYLHPQERAYYESLKFDRRIKSFLIGRYAAKLAVSGSIQEPLLANILIASGILNHPVVVHPHKGNTQVSLTHCEDVAAAIAFPEEIPMGVDIEGIREHNHEVLRAEMTMSEQRLAASLPLPDDAQLTLLWTAKEALSKILKTGLTTSFHMLEISRLELKQDVIVSWFTNFPQYCTVSWIVDPYICSITYPKRIALCMNQVGELFKDFGMKPTSFISGH